MAAEIPTADDFRSLLESALGPLRDEIERLRKALPPQYLSIEEAANVLGVSVCTVRRRVKNREIPTYRVGNRDRIDAADLRPPAESNVVDLAHRARFR
jgi:excisionase family DNA binding protein